MNNSLYVHIESPKTNTFKQHYAYFSYRLFSIEGINDVEIALYSNLYSK